MNTGLHMLELRPDPQRLISFAEGQGINRADDEDLGYLAHAWLNALFGELAPKPFRLLAGQRRHPCLLGYSKGSADQLRDHARTFALPSALAVANLDGAPFTRRMPATWSPGRRLGFEVLVCPVTRQDQKEKDVFLRRLEATSDAEPPPSREKAYIQWLADQLLPAARLEHGCLAGFQLIRVLRRSQQKAPGAHRNAPRLTRPQALLRGVLQVEDGATFNRCLARGVGRHRAFGYGMLLLRPA